MLVVSLKCFQKVVLLEREYAHISWSKAPEKYCGEWQTGSVWLAYFSSNEKTPGKEWIPCYKRSCVRRSGLAFKHKANFCRSWYECLFYDTNFKGYLNASLSYSFAPGSIRKWFWQAIATGWERCVTKILHFFS